jgi:hypothetical protein
MLQMLLEGHPVRFGRGPRRAASPVLRLLWALAALAALQCLPQSLLAQCVPTSGAAGLQYQGSAVFSGSTFYTYQMYDTSPGCSQAIDHWQYAQIWDANGNYVAGVSNVISGKTPNIYLNAALAYPIRVWVIIKDPAAGIDRGYHEIQVSVSGRTPSAQYVRLVLYNSPPTAVGLSVTTAEDTVSPWLSPSVTDPDAGDTHTFSIGAQPAGGAGTAAVSADGRTVRFVPAPDWNGSTSFTLRACDAAGACVNGTVPVSVSAVNDAPASVSGSIVTEAGRPSAPLVPTVQDVDLAREGDSHTFSVRVPPLHGAAEVTASGIVYTPADPGYSGTDSFTLRATDARGLFVEGTIAVTVACAATVSLTSLAGSSAGVTGEVAGPACALPAQAEVRYEKLDARGAATAAGQGAQSGITADLAVPWNNTLPANARAGSYLAHLALTDRAGRSHTQDVAFTLPCPAPTVRVTGASLDPQAATHALEVQIQSQDLCNDSVSVHYSVETTSGDTVAEGEQAGLPAGAAGQVTLRFAALSFGDYTATLTAADAQGLSTTITHAFSVACPAPEIIGLGTQGSSVEGMVYVADCGMPARADFIVRDGEGQAILNGTRQVLARTTAEGVVYHVIEPIDLASLADGDYSVAVTLADAASAQDSGATSLRLDRTGPTLQFLGQVATAQGSEVSVTSLGQVGVKGTDPSGVLALPGVPPPGVDGAPRAPDLSGAVDSVQVQGRLAQVSGWALAADQPGHAAYVVFRGPGGTYAVPFSRRLPRADVLAQRHGPKPQPAVRASLASGFEALIDLAGLAPGDYAIASLVLAHPAGGWASLPASGNFTVPGGVAAATLTGGAGPLALSLAPDAGGTPRLSGYPAVRSGDYTLAATLYDRLGNGETAQVAVRYRRPLVPLTASYPQVLGFPDRHLPVTLSDPLTDAPLEGGLPVTLTWVSGAGTVTVQGAAVGPQTEAHTTLAASAGQATVAVAATGIAEGSPTVVSGFIERPDAPDLLVTARGLQPENGIEVLSTKDAYVAGLEEVTVTARKRPSGSCATLVSDDAAGPFPDPVCAVRWALPLPRGLAADRLSLNGRFQTPGAQSIQYKPGVVYTHPDTGETRFYPVAQPLERRGMEGAKRRAEEPAIGARRRAQQPTHRAVESLWERAGPRLFVARRADAGRIAGLE